MNLWATYNEFQTYTKNRINSTFVILEDTFNFNTSGTPVYTGTYTQAQIDNQKEQYKALITAQYQLESCNEFNLPKVRPSLTYGGVETQSQIIATNDMKIALFEQALLILEYQSDFDSRNAIKSDGVVNAGIIKETYKSESKIPISIYAKERLRKFSVKKTFFKNFPNDPMKTYNLWYWGNK